MTDAEARWFSGGLIAGVLTLVIVWALTLL